MTIQGAIADLQTTWLAISGVKSAPTDPPEMANQFPFAVTYENNGKLAQWSAVFGHELATINSELHLTRQNLPSAVSAAMGYRDSFLRAVMADPTLGGNVSTTTDISWEFARLDYGDVQTIGYRFSIGVKVDLIV